MVTTIVSIGITIILILILGYIMGDNVSSMKILRTRNMLVEIYTNPIYSMYKTDGICAAIILYKANNSYYSDYLKPTYNFKELNDKLKDPYIIQSNGFLSRIYQNHLPDYINGNLELIREKWLLDVIEMLEENKYRI